MKRRYVVGTVIAVALAAVTPALAGLGKRIGRGSARGDYAVASAGATANDPSRLYMKVTARPRQRITASWSMTCGKGFGAGSKSGDFAGRTPEVRRMRMPMRNPDTCYIGSSAQLNDSGRIVIRLYKKPR
jgi:hypothetical protein